MAGGDLQYVPGPGLAEGPRCAEVRGVADYLRTNRPPPPDCLRDRRGAPRRAARYRALGDYSVRKYGPRGPDPTCRSPSSCPECLESETEAAKHGALYDQVKAIRTAVSGEAPVSSSITLRAAPTRCTSERSTSGLPLWTRDSTWCGPSPSGSPTSRSTSVEQRKELWLGDPGQAVHAYPWQSGVTPSRCCEARTGCPPRLVTHHFWSMRVAARPRGG